MNKMINKFLCSVLFLILFATSLLGQENRFSIDGKINGKNNGKYIMLFTFKGDSINSVDTTMIENGSFHFQGKEYLNESSIVTTGNFPDEVRAAEVILERGTIKIDLDSFLCVKGTPLNDLYKSYKKKYSFYQDTIKMLLKEQGTRSITPGTKLSIIWEKFYNYKKDFKKNNIYNIVGKEASKEDLNDLTDKDFYEIYDLADADFKTDIKVKENIKQREEYNKINAERIESKRKKFQDFELMTPTGEVKKISDYVGKTKYLFIDFWASWCNPCIADMPNLKKVYEKYKDKGLEVIGISLDNIKASWLNGLKRINVPWIQLSDLKGFSSGLTQAYKIKGIPYALLLDSNGIIIEVNLRSESLETLLQQLLQE